MFAVRFRRAAISFPQRFAQHAANRLANPRIRDEASFDRRARAKIVLRVFSCAAGSHDRCEP
jgi:hypothetical protein